MTRINMGYSLSLKKVKMPAEIDITEITIANGIPKTTTRNAKIKGVNAIKKSTEKATRKASDIFS
jgi:hypothetical protein